MYFNCIVNVFLLLIITNFCFVFLFSISTEPVSDTHATTDPTDDNRSPQISPPKLPSSNTTVDSNTGHVTVTIATEPPVTNNKVTTTTDTIQQSHTTRYSSMGLGPHSSYLGQSGMGLSPYIYPPSSYPYYYYSPLTQGWTTYPYHQWMQQYSSLPVTTLPNTQTVAYESGSHSVTVSSDPTVPQSGSNSVTLSSNSTVPKADFQSSTSSSDSTVPRPSSQSPTLSSDPKFGHQTLTNEATPTSDMNSTNGPDLTVSDGIPDTHNTTLSTINDCNDNNSLCSSRSIESNDDNAKFTNTEISERTEFIQNLLSSLNLDSSTLPVGSSVAVNQHDSVTTALQNEPVPLLESHSLNDTNMTSFSDIPFQNEVDTMLPFQNQSIDDSSNTSSILNISTSEIHSTVKLSSEAMPVTIPTTAMTQSPNESSSSDDTVYREIGSNSKRGIQSPSSAPSSAPIVVSQPSDGSIENKEDEGVHRSLSLQEAFLQRNSDFVERSRKTYGRIGDTSKKERGIVIYSL